METPLLPQSNVASLPPPEAAVIGSLASQPGICPLPVLPPPLPVSHQPNAPHQFSLLDSSRRVTRLRPVAAAVGPCLAYALQARWQSYREQLRISKVELFGFGEGGHLPGKPFLDQPGPGEDAESGSRAGCQNHPLAAPENAIDRGGGAQVDQGRPSLRA